MKEKKYIILLLVLLIVIGGILYFLFKNKKTKDLENSITNTFEADVYMYTREEGGRTTPIYVENYLPNIVIDEKYLTIKSMKSSKESLVPGEGGHITIILQKEYDLKIGDKFFLQEGGRKTGQGTITKVMKNTN